MPTSGLRHPAKECIAHHQEHFARHLSCQRGQGIWWHPRSHWSWQEICAQCRVSPGNVHVSCTVFCCFLSASINIWARDRMDLQMMLDLWPKWNISNLFIFPCVVVWMWHVVDRRSQKTCVHPKVHFCCPLALFLYSYLSCFFFPLVFCGHMLAWHCPCWPTIFIHWFIPWLIHSFIRL